ncbi:hypothetical protein [Aquidulcibacter sp.]|jgi:hypothetical protein|uniref:WapI family immunity protein n=1 Tax=Aquidulcibacter sp. TaxID=2052990 RepID=UPI0028AECC23|nr:hypothetical protein [Aquidulcibacter sp.]
MSEMPDVLLEGTNGSLRLRLVRYEFPEIIDDKWDSNWLVVFGEGHIDGLRWRFESPCLTTVEVGALADWLHKVANGEEVDEIGFMEPHLEFDLIGRSHVRVSFAMEAAPTWVDGCDLDNKIGFDISIGPHLAKAAADLRSQFQVFRVRGMGEWPTADVTSSSDAL